jgi:predicted small lipoprotein YifL
VKTEWQNPTDEVALHALRCFGIWSFQFPSSFEIHALSLRSFFQETCRIYGGDYRCDPNLSMKKLASTLLLIPTLIVVLSGCGTSGPSPEQQTRDAQQQKDAERQQAEFRKGLPPVSNPGQGW